MLGKLLSKEEDEVEVAQLVCVDLQRSFGDASVRWRGFNGGESGAPPWLEVRERDEFE